MNISLHDYKKIINVPLATAIASIIVVLCTTSSLNYNGVSALIGGNIGVVLSVLFLLVLHMTFTNSINLDLLPMFLLIGVVSLLLFYIITYFEHISTEHVPSYYTTFSWLSTVFVCCQLWIIFSAFYNTELVTSRLFSRVTLCVLGLINLIHWGIVVTLGIVLQYYSTQG